MDKYFCHICYEDVRYAEKYSKIENINYLKCRGPRHKLVKKEVKVKDIQEDKHGLYVNPLTGKIEKAKQPIRKVVKKIRIKKTQPLNTPMVLGKE